MLKAMQEFDKIQHFAGLAQASKNLSSMVENQGRSFLVTEHDIEKNTKVSDYEQEYRKYRAKMRHSEIRHRNVGN